MRCPFSIKVATIAGKECIVEVVREQTVSALCDEVALRFDVKAYRLSLAHAGGRLSPLTATLEDCGVTGAECEIGASFSEVDPLKELTLVQFLELAVQHKLS